MKKGEMNGMNGQPALNGQPSMEEILASIRKIIAEEPIGATPPFPEPRLISGTNARADSAAEDASDFDLPSILRPSSQPSPEKHTPLFGRLADALRGATSANNNAANNNTAPNTEIKIARSPADEPSAEHKDAPLPAGPAPAPIEINQPALSLSSLTPARAEPVLPAPAPSAMQPAASPAPSSAPAQATTPAPAPDSAPAPVVVAPLAAVPHVVASVEEPKIPDEPRIAAPALRSGGMSAPRNRADAGGANSRTADGVRRVMVPFKDQRLSLMGGMSSFGPEPWPPAKSGDAFASNSEGFGAPPDPLPAISDPDTAAASASALDALAMGLAGSVLNPFPSDMPEGAPVSAQESPPVIPPAIPAASPVELAGASVKDTAAELLRPMLRQWLADNMPRIVEQALHIEVAESLKPKK